MQLIGIDILINGRRHGVRRWAAVPRIGELVWVQKGSNPDIPEDGWYRVKMVRWCERVSLAELECEPADDGQSAK